MSAYQNRYSIGTCLFLSVLDRHFPYAGSPIRMVRSPMISDNYADYLFCGVSFASDNNQIFILAWRLAGVAFLPQFVSILCRGSRTLQC